MSSEQAGSTTLSGSGRSEHAHPPHGSVRFYSHSQLFYFWPLWMASLGFAAVTAVAGKTFVYKAGDTTLSVSMVTQPGLGLAYLLILMSVVLFTSVNIRGVWAALVAAVVVIVGLVFVLLDWWGPILAAIGGINFFINLHFYLWVGAATLVLWLAVFFLYDRRHYIEIRPTQVTIVEEVGDGEKNFDTVGLVFDKKRDNFFQHWLLGFGSGDLIVTTAGGQSEQIHLPNVLRIGKRIAQLQNIREQRGR